MTAKPSRKVVGADRELVELAPLDIWPLPYRGSRYTIKEVGGTIRAVWEWQEFALASSNYPKRVHQLMREAGKPRGSLVVTAHGDLITKIPTDDGQWKPLYLGEYQDDFKFDQVDNNPSGLQMGEHWTGFPFHHGERWTISPRDERGELMWKYVSHWFPSTELFPDLALLYRRIRFTGGRLYFTEHGHVWMNIRDDELSDFYLDDFRSLQSEQLDRLSETHRDVVLKLIAARLANLQVRPIYLGHVDKLCRGEAPWTAFPRIAAGSFGHRGDEPALDDGDIEGKD
jgi:hypothetical protein